MGDKVQEVDAVFVQRQDVLTALAGVTVPPDRKEARTKELPLGEDLEDLGLCLARAHVLDLGPGALHHIHPLGRLDVAG